MPAPRIALGVALRGIAHSAIDISDGLVADLGHICERSRVAALIEYERLPVSGVMRRHRHLPIAQRAICAGGDDYELCFTASRHQHAQVLRAGKRANVAVTCIGRIIAARARSSRVALLDAVGNPVPFVAKGFDHFG